MTKLEERLSDFPFSMEALKKRFGAGVEYLGLIVHPKINNPVYAFYQPEPNRELGHTEFFGLVYDYQTLYVMKLIGEELEEYAVHNAVYCRNCEDVVMSLFRHDMQVCSCKKAFADGGGAYLRMSHLLDAKLLRVNTLTKKIVG